MKAHARLRRILCHGRSYHHQSNAKYEHRASHRFRAVTPLVSEMHKVSSRCTGDASDDYDERPKCANVSQRRNQILGCILNEVAESIRSEVIISLRKVNSMQLSQVMKTTISNMVFSAWLRRKLCLRNIVITDVKLFHEVELFPAALI